MIDHAFTPRPIADERIISAFPRCAYPTCGGAQHEHQEMDAEFLAAFYGIDDAGRPTEHAQTAGPTCGRDGGAMTREKGCLACNCYSR